MAKRRIPVVLQMNSVECGAACLAMVLGYFGRKTRLEECRATCDPGRDGVTAQTIVAAARGFGLRTKALSVDAKGLSNVNAPCIVYWNSNHFVVLERCARGRVEIVDPAWGRRQLTPSEFETAFSGVALFFEPGPDFHARSMPGPNLPLNSVKQILRTPGTAQHAVADSRGFAASAGFRLRASALYQVGG